MALDGPDAEEQSRRDFLVAEPFGYKRQNLERAVAQLGKFGRRRQLGKTEEIPQIGSELRPCGLVHEQDVVATHERDEPRAGDQRGQPAPLRKRDQRVVAGMHHKRWACHALRLFRHVVVITRIADSNRGFRIARHTLKFVEPLHLLRAGARDEQRGEQTAKGGQALARIPSG